MKRKALALLYALTVSMLLSACSGSATHNSAISNEDIEVFDTLEAMKRISDDVYIVPQSLDNPDLVIVWDISEEEWNSMKEADPDAFNLVYTTKEAFEALYGGTVTVYGVGWGEMMNKTLEMVSNGEPCDLVQAHDQNFPKYASENAVMDISQYIDLEDDFWYDNVTEAFTFGGTHYVAGAEATPVCISYNKTLFEEKGIKTPKEYFDEDNWTWDTFKEVCMEMTDDTDHDGENDVYGFGWWDSFWVMFNNTNGINTLNYLEDGSVQGNFFNDEAKESFEFLQNAYTKDKFIFPPEKGDFVNAYKEGKIAMTCEYGFTAKVGFPCDYEIDWAPLPKGPSGAKYDCGGGLQGFAIPVTSTNPEGAAAFVRIAYELMIDYNQRQRIERYGLEDVELMNQLAKHVHFNPIGVDKYWDAQWTIYHGISTGIAIDEFTKDADNFFKATDEPVAETENE